MTPEEISGVLYRVLSDESKALKRGIKDRERIAKALENGETPTGHRVDWIQETVLALNETLMAQAKKFNEAYPGDKISNNDLMDTLVTLLGMFKKLSARKT